MCCATGIVLFVIKVALEKHANCTIKIDSHRLKLYSAPFEITPCD